MIQIIRRQGHSLKRMKLIQLKISVKMKENWKIMKAKNKKLVKMKIQDS